MGGGGGWVIRRKRVAGRVRAKARRELFRHLAFESYEAREMLSSVPLAVNDPTFYTPLNTTLNGSGIMSNDWDPDGGTLTASVVANPSHGSLSSFTGSTGAFTFVPTTGYVGLDSFTYKVNDGSLDSNVATVSIAVGGNTGARTNVDEIPRDGMLLTGGLTLSQPLLMDQNLVYRSDSYPHPVVVVETSLLSLQCRAQFHRRPIDFRRHFGLDGELQHQWPGGRRSVAVRLASRRLVARHGTI